MKLFARAISIFLIVVGASCGKRDGAPNVTGSGSATAVSGSGSAITAGSAGMATGSGSDQSASPAGSAAAGSTVDSSAAMSLQTATGRYGILLAETPGGKVTLTLDGGKTEELADLTIVKVMGDAAGPMRVDVGGKQGTVKTDRIVYDDDIQRSPKGDFAVVTPLIECEDVCTKAVWLVHGSVKRWRALDSAVSPAAAWHPQGTNVAIGGSGQLVVLELPSGEVLNETNGYMGPAYSPDGTLYVRDDNFGVFTFADGKATKVGKGKKPKRIEGEFAVDPKPVTFGPDGKFKTID